MSGRIHKSQIPLRSASQLSAEARAALAEAKNRLKAGEVLKEFRNDYGGHPGDGSPLPRLRAGCRYYEVIVGQSRDPEPTDGCKRFVLMFHVHSRQVLEIYYTDHHYFKFSFFQILN
jgi:hypothetical protein